MNKTPSAVVLDDERAAFEVYAKTRFNATDMEPWIRHPEEYNSRETQAAWHAWRARAASPQPVAQSEPLPDGIQKLTDTDRLDFIEAQGIDYSCPLDGSTSAWIAGMTVVEEPEPGEKAETFNLRRAIDFAMHQHKKRNLDNV